MAEDITESTSPTSGRINLVDLPNEIIFVIFSFLPAELLIPLSYLCKKWAQYSSEDIWWKGQFKARWNLFDSSSSSPPLPLSPSTTPRKRNNKKEKRKTTQKIRLGEWKQAFTYQTLQKTPVVFLHYITKTMAGFAGERYPFYYKLSTRSQSNSFVYPCIIGREIRQTAHRVGVFRKFTEEGTGDMDNADFLFKPDNSCSKEDLAKFWVVLFQILKVIDPRIQYEDEVDTERYYQAASRPILYVMHNNTINTLDLASVREIAFEILRAPAFCACTFGELVLFPMNKTNGIVVDFGTDFDSFQQMKAYAKFCETREVQQNPQHVFIEHVQDGKRVSMAAMPRELVNETSVAEAIRTIVSFNESFQQDLQNIVLVGSNPLSCDPILAYLKPLFPHINISVIQPSNKEFAIWEGASLFALSTHTDPAYYASNFSPAAVETGKWMSKRVYVNNMRAELDRCYELALDSSFDNLQSSDSQKAKCTIS